MILNLDTKPAGLCFQELNDALVAMGRDDVALNAHESPSTVPEGATVWHWENEAPDYGDRCVWSFSRRQATRQGWAYATVGHHPTMERFDRAPEQDIDVAFTGCLNGRRAHLFNRLVAHGLRVVVVPPGVYGAQRDAILARAKLAVNMLFYADGVYPVLRAAHLVANSVPMVSEVAPEIPLWAGLRVDAGDLELTILRLLREPQVLRQGAELALEAFRRQPMELPS